jgi:rSAM/selenodomain-associated transferase 1
MNTAACIVVFAKAPVAGLVKTRLIPALGAQGAAKLAQRLLEHAVDQAVQVQGAAVELCMTPDLHDPMLLALSQQYGVTLSPQGDGDLGNRMHRAFQRVLQTHGAAILIGTDAPAMNTAMLKEALAALATHDAVFIPALDGGYALAGLRQPCAALFEGMVWSTATVMQETRRRATLAHIHWHELPPVNDIDEPTDLVHVPLAWLPAPVDS